MGFNEMTNCSYLPLTEVLSSIVDNRGKSVPTADTGFPLIATNCIKNDELYPVFEKIRYVSPDTYANWFRAHPLPGDIIFVTKGSPGRVCMVPEPVGFCIAQDMIAIRANEKIINNKYLFAVLRSPQFQTQIDNFHVGTLIPHFKKGDLDKLLIPIPHMSVQEFIGNLYYLMCEKIELNNRINKILEEIAQAVFKSWFVDFEPFQDGDFEDSELGRIPKGWRVGILDELAGITMGQSPKGTSYNSHGDGVVFYQGCTDFRHRYPKARLFTTEPKRVAEKGDILLSVRAPVGAVNVAMERCCIGRGLASLRSRCGNNSFLLYLLFSLRPSFEVFNGEGTVFGSINKEALKTIKIIIPPDAVIERFQRIVGPLDKLIEMNSWQSDLIAAIRDALLPRLMSGEIEVPIGEV